MLSDLLGVWWFVIKSSIVEVEKKRQNLKFYGGFKRHLHNNDRKFDKEIFLMTLDVLQSFHNETLNKKLKERPINI
jgi:hypothetical protein